MMVHDRFRRVKTPPSGQLRAPAQVYVFHQEKEFVVEQADLIQHNAAIGGRSATGTEHEVLAVVLADVFLPYTAISSAAIDSEIVPGGVEMIALIVKQHFAGDRTDIGKSGERIHHRLSPIRFDFSIIIQQRDNLALRSLNTD